jgi:hypothetical protein
MKKPTNLCRTLVLAGTVLLTTTAGSAGILPASSRWKQVQSNDSISSFWEKFRTAVIKGDKETVAALSQFPISRGYGIASIKNKAQLIKQYRNIFFNETNAAKCFPKAKPIVDKGQRKEFIIGCPFASGGEEEPFEYRFTLTRSGWKFTGFENINE